MSNEAIFEQKDNLEVKPESISSFEDCPNNCVDGYYVDPYKHKRLLCLHCLEKRKKSIKQGIAVTKDSESIAQLLNLPVSFRGYGTFDISHVIPEFARRYIVKDSIDAVAVSLNSLLNDVSLGTPSDCSYVINLGSRAYDSEFVFSYLFRAYVAGLTVAPYVTSYDLHQLRLGATRGSDECTSKYNVYLTSQVCMVNIDAGASQSEIDNVKGLMQMRAHRDLATIVVIHCLPSKVLNLVNESGNEKSKYLAVMIAVEYTSTASASEEKYVEAQSRVKNRNSSLGLNQTEFNNLMRPRDSL